MRGESMDNRINQKSPFLVGERVRIVGTRRMVSVVGYAPYSVLVRDGRGRHQAVSARALEYRLSPLAAVLHGPAPTDTGANEGMT